MEHFRRHGIIAIVALLMVVAHSAPLAAQEDLSGEFHNLVDQEDEAFLLNEISKVGADSVLQRLARFQRYEIMMQGHFFGPNSDQLVCTDAAAVPSGDAGELDTAITLARWRESNRRMVLDLGLPVEFVGDEGSPESSWPPLTMHLEFDWTVPAAFLAALEDMELTSEEIIQIVELPANRELLRFCDSCRAFSARLVVESDIAFHMSRAASSDPLDRLWCWLSPAHHLGYADLSINGYQYRSLLEELQNHQGEIADAVVARIAPFLPPDIEVSKTVALSVCCPVSVWSTSRMIGVNVEHLKGGWEHLVRTISAAVFDQLQRQLCSTKATPEGLTSSDLDCEGSAKLRSDPLEWAIYTAVLIGTANYVADLGALAEEEHAVRLGAELLHSYVGADINLDQSAVTKSPTPDENAPRRYLCALGRRMARIITAYEGPQAVTEFIRRGPAAFVIRAAELESARGHDLLTEETYSAIRDLAGQS